MNQPVPAAESSAIPLTSLRADDSAVRVSTLVGGSDSDPVVDAIVLDSRQAAPGGVWAALSGTRTHGARHADGPIAAGVAAILTDPEGEQILAESYGSDALASGVGPVVLVCDQPRAVTARWAARLHGRPGERMTTFAVTGTNGKSTTTFLLQMALRALGQRTGLIGTVGFHLDDEPIPAATTSTVTTPEAPDLQATLGRLADAGADALAMEVSSHALALHRADGIVFDVAGFTNLGRDHLDFHADLEDYFAAKARLFTAELSRRVVLPLDDPYGHRLVEQVRAERPDAPLVTVSLDDPDAADVGVRSWTPTETGSRVEFVVHGRAVLAEISLPGVHNVRNALLALGMVVASGVDDLDTAVEGFALVRVPGRMEPVVLEASASHPIPPRVFVDFAHTPQAVRAAGESFADAGPVVIVVGSGGDRDPGKRAPIGEAAALGADVVVVTDDNPRSEDPAAIRAEILAGARAVEGGRAHEVVDGGDRAAAIRLGLETACATSPVATVLVLGRGHETQQLTADGPVDFHDPTVVAQQWQDLAAPGRGAGS